MESTVLNTLVNAYSSKWLWHIYSCVIYIHTPVHYKVSTQVWKCYDGSKAFKAKVSVMKTEELLGTHFALFSLRH